MQIGFKQSLVDPCLFTCLDQKFMILVYVDNITMATPTTAKMLWFRSKLSKQFCAKDLGEIKKILGIHVTWNHRERTLYID